MHILINKELINERNAIPYEKSNATRGIVIYNNIRNSIAHF